MTDEELIQACLHLIEEGMRDGERYIVEWDNVRTLIKEFRQRGKRTLDHKHIDGSLEYYSPRRYR